jgi:MFS family permease
MITMGAASPTTGPRTSISASEHVAGWTPPRFFKLKRMMLAIAGALVSVNMWTGGPLLALWVGSQFEGWLGTRAPSTGVSMKAVLVVVVVLAVLEMALALLLARVSDAYDKLIGRPHKARRTSPWLRSLRGEREKSEPGKYRVSVVERIAIISVVVCVLAFEAWFFFLPRSALPY